MVDESYLSAQLQPVTGAINAVDNIITCSGKIGLCTLVDQNHRYGLYSLCHQHP